jgi:hypothetical protein
LGDLPDRPAALRRGGLGGLVVHPVPVNEMSPLGSPDLAFSLCLDYRQPLVREHDLPLSPSPGITVIDVLTVPFVRANSCQVHVDGTLRNAIATSDGTPRDGLTGRIWHDADRTVGVTGR